MKRHVRRFGVRWRLLFIHPARAGKRFASLENVDARPVYIGWSAGWYWPRRTNLLCRMVTT